MEKRLYILITSLLCLISVSALAQKKDSVDTSVQVVAAGGGGGCTAPSNPGNPTASTNTCGAKTLTRSGTPPLGTQWYWQTVSNGTSVDNSSSTYTANSSGTYYLRAYKPSCDLWSSGAGYVTVTVNQNPAAPSTPTFQDNCSSGVLTRGTPPSGVTWYWQGLSSSGTSTANSASTYTVTSSGTYYIRSYNNSSGCWGSSTGIAVTLTAPPSTPPAPLSSGNSCGDVALSWNGTPPSEVRWYWQTSAEGMSTGNMTSSYTASASGTYYLRAYHLMTGCWSSASQISVTVNPLPSPPSSPSSQVLCGQVQLTRGTPPSGHMWYWQGTNATGTSTGDANTTYAATATGTYYLRTRNNSTGCWSASTGVSVTVTPIPSAPSTPTVESQCSSSVLTRGTPPSGVTWYWQGTNASGTSTADAATTYAAYSQTTYYIRAYNNTTGCWSASSTPVSSVFLTPPGIPPTPLSSGNSCGDVTLSWNGTPSQFLRWTWQTSPGGTDMSQITSNYVVSASGTYYLRSYDLNSTCWSPGASQITVTVNQPPSAPATPSSDGISCGASVLTRGTPPTGVTWYWQGTNSSGISAAYPDVTYNATSSGTYYLRARNNSTLCWSTTSASVTVTVNPLPATPTAPTIVTSCGTGVIQRSAPVTGETWYWQGTNPSGTSAADANSTYAVPSSGTYYLRARNNSSLCWSSSSSSVVITVNPLPAAPNNPTIINTCGTGTLQRSEHPMGVTWYWQGTNSSGTSTTNADATYAATASGTYYLRARDNSTGCWSNSSGSVTINLNAAVGNPSPVNGSREEPGVVNLSASIGTNGDDNKWYESQAGGTLLSSSPSYSPSVSSTTTYYVSSYKTTTGCESSRVAITATIQPKPVISGSGSTFTMGNTIQLSVSNNTYDTYSWKLDNAEIGTSSAITVNRAGSYTVTVSKSGMTGSGTSSPLVLNRSIDDQSPMNYIIVNGIIKEGVTSSTDIDQLTSDERSRTISYLGGLGNSLQQIVSQASPMQKDIIQTPKYDVHGRQLEQYLPYVSVSGDSKFRPQALDNGGYTTSEQYLFYQQTNLKLDPDTKPYSKTEVEPSPFQRALFFTGPGEAWHSAGKKVAQEFLLNRASENIRLWKVVSALPVSTSVYPDYQLHASLVTDENGNQTKVYVDKLGRTIQKEVQATATEWLRTAFVYDDLGRLAFTISPEGVKAANYSPNQTFLDQWAFQYKYDALGRLIEYKAPAAGWMYTVYDKLNRPTLTQNADQRGRDEWAFVKYDVYGRPVVTGYKVIASSTRASIQASVDGQPYPFELASNTDVGYTLGRTFPTASETDLLSMSYFDNYSFLSYSGWDAQALNYAFVSEQGTSSYNDAVVGLPTGSKIRIVGTTSWLNAVQYYDKSYRPIQTIAENHLGTLDRSTNTYNNLRQLSESRLSHNNGAVVVLKKMTYDHGRLTRIYQNINNAPADQLVAQYEYNELGQLVDKKLHNTSGTDFLQSVDYRYNIRGWMSSINNSQLNVNTENNDEANDYFGIEFLYEKQELGLNDQSNDERYFNGNISAIKWKGIGAGANAADQQSYKYKYDKSGRMLAATSQMNDGTTWTKLPGAFNETVSYDHNGNIQSILRNHLKHQIINGVPTQGVEAVDNLNFAYNINQPNQLINVQDAISNLIGNGDFKDNEGTQYPTEYRYNTDGNLTSDKNKGIDSIYYNVLGKIRLVEFSDGRTITYTYDGAGNKLRMIAQKSLQITTTDYVSGGFVYENNALRFFSSPEGRVTKNGNNFEYEYAIADHQGNTRVVFTSATPQPLAPVATFEGDANDNSDQYNFDPGFVVNSIAGNHTPSGGNVIRMNQTYKIGPSKSLKVSPGDKIDMEVWEYHEGSSGFGTSTTASAVLINLVSTAFGGVNGGAGESGAIYSGVDEAITTFGSGGNQGSSRPAAYLNFILFDENYNVLDAGWRPAPDVTFTKQKISFETKDIEQEGYMFVYLSYDNDSPNWVFFDDFKVTHTKTNVIQYNEYYPFGLQTENSWTRENSSNNFLFNGGSELNSNTGWYETFFRGYDAALGRFNQIDPLSYACSSHSPYNFAFNNPVLLNDPNGDYPRNTYIPMTFEWDDGGGGGGGGSLYPTFGPNQYGQHFYGAGSMNDWFNQYGGIERNARMMTRSNFNSFYHINGDQDRARVADNASTTIYSGGKWNLSAVTGYMTHSEDKNGNIVGDVYITIDQVQQADSFQTAGGPPSYTPPPKDGFPGFPDAEKAKPKGGRPRWKLPDGDIIEWDGQHGELERYNPRGKHIGVWNPQGEMIKDPVPGRTIEPIVSPDPWYIPSAKTVERTLIWGTVAVGVGIIVFDIVTIPSGEGLIGVQMIGAALAR